jgi:hypothetical protein
MNVGVMKDYKLRDLHASHTLGRGTGTPKEKDEVNNREVCECSRNPSSCKHEVCFFFSRARGAGGGLLHMCRGCYVCVSISCMALGADGSAGAGCERCVSVSCR